MLTVRSQVRFWSLVFIAFIIALWLLKPVLLPFLAGMAIAYFLNPVVNKLRAQKIPRWAGALIVLFCFTLLAGGIIFITLPLLQEQIGTFINNVPGYIEKIRHHYIPWIENWVARFSPEAADKLKVAAAQQTPDTNDIVGNVVRKVVAGGSALIDTLLLVILTPVVAFYMLRDWPKMIHAIDSLLPRRYYDVIHSQLDEIDSTLSGFVRGQALVCLTLGVFYGLGLTAVGLDYGATIGIVAGLLSFIPYVGTTFGWVTSVLIATAQFNANWSHIGLVIIVFLIGQALEAYILIPRLVGNRVGLHALWIVFAMLAGGELFGFTGILVAVPMAAIIGVITRFALRQYKASPVYKDTL